MNERLKSLRREATLVEYVSGMLWRQSARAYLRLFHRIRITGAEHIPSQLPFVIVANHTSHLDAIGVGALLRSNVAPLVYPVAAEDTFFRNRTRSILTALTVNALPIARRSPRRGILEIGQLRERLISGNCGYILFPEGTRSRTGEMAEFKRGIGMLVADTEIPVVPCFLGGFFEAFPPERMLPRAVPLCATFGSAITFRDTPNTTEGWSSVAAQLESAVRKLSSG